MKRIGSIFRFLAVAIILGSVTALLVAMTYSGSIKNAYHWTKSQPQAAVPTTEDHIRSLLAEVQDSELAVSIVDLGLVYDVRLPNPGVVDVTMTLTTPYCPYSRTIVDDIQKTLMADPSVNDVRLRIVFEPAWSWNRVDKEVRDRIIRQFSALPAKNGDRHD